MSATHEATAADRPAGERHRRAWQGRKLASIGGPASWALALAVMLLPFVSVSCDTPGGFGRMEAGGTTEWSGFDLAFGSAPSVDESHLRPAAEQQSDDVGVQPLILVGALALAVAIVIVALRPAVAAVLGLVAAVAIVVGTLLARSEVTDLVAAQATETFPPGTSAGDHVAVGLGFWAATALALVGAAMAALGSRRPPAGAAP